jgi:5-formyltetrahydrofolate cyclo-ligase
MVVPPHLPGAMLSKADLRREMRARRCAFVDTLSADDELAPGSGLPASMLERRLADRLPPLPSGAVIASYRPIGDEIDPHYMEQELRHAGHVIAWPRIDGAELHFHACPADQMVGGVKGIEEPPATAAAHIPDVLIVPLVAADLAGNRLGQAGGYYDRTLRALRAAKSIVAIGVAWDVQIVPSIPVDPWDEPLDWLATPERLVRCADHR